MSLSEFRNNYAWGASGASDGSAGTAHGGAILIETNGTAIIEQIWRDTGTHFHGKLHTTAVGLVLERLSNINFHAHENIGTIHAHSGRSVGLYSDSGFDCKVTKVLPRPPVAPKVGLNALDEVFPFCW